LRYDGICARLKRLENIGVGVAGTIIMLLVTIVMKIS
jgi:hypothetical protein